jgi:hypothetical protein
VNRCNILTCRKAFCLFCGCFYLTLSLRENTVQLIHTLFLPK